MKSTNARTELRGAGSGDKDGEPASTSASTVQNLNKFAPVDGCLGDEMINLK